MQDSYSFDANGNVTAITGSAATAGLASRAMAYDGLDRLTAANGIWGAGQFSYDALDNLRSTYISGGATPRSLTHLYDPTTNRLTGVAGTYNVTLAYDANGNITNRAGQPYVFDIGNRVSSAPGVAYYYYDGHGRRSYTLHNSSRTTQNVYSQAGRLLLTLDSQRGTTKHIHLGDKVVAETNSQTGTRWLHTDALGSPVATTGVGGVLLQRTHYEPYGQNAGGAVPDGIGFTGHVNDVATGLVYMQQRYYDPIAGRFLSVDPVVTNASNGSFFNRYVYTNNNPYRYVDPDGRSPCTGSRIASSCDAGGGVARSHSGGSINVGDGGGQRSQSSGGAVAPAPPGVGSGSGAASGSGLRAAAAGAGRLLGPLSLAVTPSNLGDATLYGARGFYAPTQGMILYRVWGGDSAELGRSWTPVNPAMIGSAYRDLAGLPAVNDGSMLSIGILTNHIGVFPRPAIPLDGNRGGLPELVVPSPGSQIRLIHREERNPPF